MFDMSKDGWQARPRDFSKARSSWVRRLFSILMILGLFASMAALAAEEPDTQYLRVYDLSDQGDAFMASGQTNQAKAKYQEAVKELLELKQNRPAWNPQVVSYRLGYLREKLAAFEKRAPAPVVEKPAARPQAKPQTSSAPGQLKLLDAGAEPRKLLRLHVKAGDQQKSSLSLKLAMDMQMGSVQTQAMKIPTITMEMETTVTNVSDKGDITYASTITGASVADEAGGIPQMADAMKSSFANIKGITTVATVTDRGANKSTQVQLPGGADPQMKQAMDQMRDQMKAFSGFSAPFPEEPVGKGARWQIAIPIKTQGISVTPAATFELVSLDGDRYTLKVTLAAQMANQRIQNPQMPQMRMDLGRLTANGTGTISSDLTHLMPSSATLDARLDLQMAMNMGNQRQPMNMKVNIGIGLESK